MGRAETKEIGAYTPTEVAHYLRVPLSTLRSWVFGQSYKSSKGPSKFFEPVVQIADPRDRLISFNNLVEINVLAGIRKVHDIPLPKIRKGLRFVQEKLSTSRPLLTQEFLAAGLDLFVERSGLLLNVTREGQLTFRETIERFVQRIERDPAGVPIRLFPFSRHAGHDDERKIVIDPDIAFGRPVLVGTAVPTSNVFERFLAGEPIRELAQDFSVNESLIEEAIRCEQVREAA
ncbi:MAG: DUF433 domain-containing protein [Deltaproteobacteria bacterium]|nr:DUF433 domain-containing protein [Deltaproteobacteria bacterium]